MPPTMKRGPLQLRVESGRMFTPSEVAGTVLNMVATSKGTLRGATGPLPVLPDYGQGAFAYGNPHGIVHARLMKDKTRDVLLVHHGTRIDVLDGAARTWERVIGDGAGTTQVIVDLPDETAPGPPTMFEVTPNGIVIVPRGGTRAFFYDGERAGFLGYDTGPGAPIVHGAETEDVADSVNQNDRGFLFTGQHLHFDYGRGRCGTIADNSDTHAVLGSAYQFAYRWIDLWSNLSPLSPRSNPAAWNKETDTALGGAQAESRLKIIIVRGLEEGPDGTIGLDVGATRDMNHSGTVDLFHVPNGSGGNVSGAFATIPGNASAIHVHNVADSVLVLPMEETDPMPAISLYRQAFGRGWLVPIDEPHILIPTLPGRWGTPTRSLAVVPDPRGGAITTAWASTGGLLVTTVSSTYLVTPSNDGLRFKSGTVHPAVGGMAPDSFDSLPDGRAIWLAGPEGFATWDGSAVALVSPDEQDFLRRVNWSRAVQATGRYDPYSGEYRCWLPYDGSIENAMCFAYDAKVDGWRRRTIEQLRAVCVTRDHRRLMLGVGRARSVDGAWVVDHDSHMMAAPSATYQVDTSWLGWEREERKTPMDVNLFLRESRSGTVTVSTFRNWQEEVVYPGDSHTVTQYTTEDVPPFWGTTTWNEAASSDARRPRAHRWIRRRPFWVRRTIRVPACEVFKVRLQSTSPFEFIGMTIDEIPLPERERVPRS